MNTDDLSLRGTIALADDLIRVSKSYESANYATLLRSPYWWVAKRLWLLRTHRERRLRNLRRERTELVMELHRRFEGVLYELFTQESAPDEFGSYIDKLWRQIQVAVLSLDDHRRFSTVLWQIHVGLGPDIRELRPKFMLRQFVDEMPDAAPRTALRILAYGGQYEAPDVTSETMRYVWQAYPLLHKEVVGRLDDLSLLSGNELTPALITKLDPPAFQYHLWLFRWKDAHSTQ